MSQLVDVMHVVFRVEEVLEGRWQHDFRHHFEYILECLADAINEEQDWFSVPWEEFLEPTEFFYYGLQLGVRSERIFFELKRFIDLSVYSKEIGTFQEYSRGECGRYK